MPLKFENTAEVGQTIRAYDFEIMPDRPDRYVEGVVIDKTDRNGTAVYVIKCTVDTGFPEGCGRVGVEVYVPMQVTFVEHDNRIMLLATK